MKVVGKNVTKIDAFKLARGEPVFTDDFTRPRMLYAKVLRSPHPHARILNVDATAALKRDGVVDVIWHKDVKAIPYTRAGQSYPEPSPYDTLILSPKARFIGDRVAVVVAESVAQATDALDHIVVDYEELPALTDMDEALANSEILIHDQRRRADRQAGRRCRRRAQGMRSGRDPRLPSAAGSGQPYRTAYLHRLGRRG
jgi:CO/xanthine dehydrogenase Mo-binding subunit